VLQSEQSRRIPTLIKEGHSSILKSRGSNPFYGVADDKEGNVIALKFIIESGEQRAIHYHDILSPMDYNGENQIIISTTRLKVIIDGKNLDDLFDYIIQHRVKELKEPRESFPEIGEKDVEISSIRFEMLQ